MSSNFRDFKIESVGGKIQNVSSLCSYIKNTNILPEDIAYLESLRNKLANDDLYKDVYTNEYPIVDVLQEKLLVYYITKENFELSEIISILEVYNKSFSSIDVVNHDGLTYFVFDYDTDIEVVCLNDPKRFIELVKNNANTFANKNISSAFSIMRDALYECVFKEDIDDVLSDYANRFNIDYPIYSAKDMNGNKIYKLKNGLFTKNGNELFTLITPTLVDKKDNEQMKVVNKNKKYKSFDLNEFISLRDKMLDSELVEEQDIEQLYYQVRYLINTMNRRTNGEDEEYSEALDVYMNRLAQINDIQPDMLSDADKSLLNDYNKNLQKIVTRAA